VKKHGPIFGFYFGSTPAVILANHDLIKEAFKSDSLAARPYLVAGKICLQHLFNSKSVILLFNTFF
jgi:hypothetical protein